MEERRKNIGNLAAKGVGWSIVQNWGGRLVVFLLFVVLTRFLGPTEFGVASAATVFLLLITQIAEFGFSDAVVQRRDLDPADINLPFYVSLVASILLAVVGILVAGRIEAWLGIAGLAPVIQVLAPVAPLTTLSQFQEMSYRRALSFRRLAFRVLIANFIAGSVAAICAGAGVGVWSLVVNAYLVALVGAVWLWSRPLWYPNLDLRPRGFMSLARFGLPVVSMRLLDFAATRFVEVLLIGRYGVAVYGLYAAGSRLYTTLLQLLQSALGNVSLTILSRISDDRERMADVYLRTMTMAAFTTMPIFVACAVLIPEISALLFGERWAGVETISRPLLLLGSVQSLQFFNGPFLTARGRPGTVLTVGMIRSAAVPLSVGLLPVHDLSTMIVVFSLAQLAGMPVSFTVTLQELRIPVLIFVRRILPALIACGVASAVVCCAREVISASLASPLLSVGVLGLIFALCFSAIAFVLGYREVTQILAFISARWHQR